MPPAATVQTVWRISNWDKTYEDGSTRRRSVVPAVPVPVYFRDARHDELCAAPDGPAGWGVFCSLVMTAGACIPRGYLVISDSSGAFVPHTADTLADATGIGRGWIVDWLPRLGALGFVERVPLTAELSSTIRNANRMIRSVKTVRPNGTVRPFAENPRERFCTRNLSQSSEPFGLRTGRGKKDALGVNGQTVITGMGGITATETVGGLESESCTNGNAFCQPPNPGRRVGDHAALVKFWTERWAERWGINPRFGPREARHIKEILSPPTNLPGAKIIINRYLADRDPFIVRKRHPLGLLIAEIDRWRAVDPNAPVNDADEYAAPDPDDPRLPTAAEAAAFLRGDGTRRTDARPVFGFDPIPTPADRNGPQNSFDAGGDA